MLIKHKKNKIINLENVSNIFIDLYSGGNGKVIFNMSYSVKIFGDKITPDYVYWNFNDEYELNTIKNIFLDGIRDWVHPVEDGQRYVNSRCISSIGTDEHKNRVIFNLNYPVSHPRDVEKMTSDFVFFNFNNKSAFYNFVETLEHI